MLNIFWTPKAEETFDIIIDIIENNWSILAARKFIETTNYKN